MPFLLRFQLIDLGRDDPEGAAARFEPILQFEILLHPAAARIQYDQRVAQGPAAEQVALDQLLPLPCDQVRNSRVPITGKINEAVTSIDLEEIDRLSTARSGTRVGQPTGPRQRIYQTGFANITAA